MNSELLEVLWRQFNRYKDWLGKQNISRHTRRAYLSRLNQFFVFIAGREDSGGDLLKSPRARDLAVQEYKQYLKVSLRYSAATINTTLSTLDHFYSHLGLGEADVAREVLPRPAPSPFSAEEEDSFLRALDRTMSLRDRALAFLFLGAGLRLGECAALNLQDVEIRDEAVSVRICSSRSNRQRLIALDAQSALALKQWLARRAARFASGGQAVFLSRSGRRITTAGIDFAMRKLGRTVALEVSSEILRQTCLVKLLGSGTDVHLVRNISGHKRLETTRRYCLPTGTGGYMPPAAPG